MRYTPRGPLERPAVDIIVEQIRTMRPPPRMKILFGSWSCLVVVASAQGQPDARGKTPYDYVNPLIGTTNGGQYIP